MKKIFALFGTVAIQGLDTIKQQMSGLDQSMEKMTKQLNKQSRNFQKLGATLTKNVTLPLAGLGAAVIKFGGDFEDAMTKSTAIMGNVTDDMRKKMEATARTVATSSTISAKQAADAYYYLASAGKTAEQSIAALPKVAKFAEAGNFDMALATDLLTDAQSALGLTSKDTATDMRNMVQLSDVLVKANTLANASVQQFSEALTNKAGAAMKAVGMQMEEGVAVLAAFADQGIKGSEAGTQFGIVLRDLQTKALANKQAFKDANIEVFDQLGELRSMPDIIGDVEDALAGMSDEEQKATLLTLGFTDKSVASMMALIGTSEKIREYETNLRQAGGTTDEVAKKQLESFNAQMTIMKNKLIDAAIALSNDLLPVIQNHLFPVVLKLIEKIRAIVQWFNNLSQPVKTFIIAVSTMAAVLGPFLFTLGKLIGIIGGIRNAMLLLNAAMAANPIGAIITAVAALTMGLIALHAAYKDVNKVQEENRRLLKEDVENKQLEMKKNLLEELIYNYNKLAHMDTQVISREEYAASKAAIERLETSIGDFGIEFTGSFLNKLDDAKEKLREFTEGVDQAAEDTWEAAVIMGDSEEEVAKDRELSEMERLEAKKNRLEEEIIAEKEKIRTQIEINRKVDRDLKKMESDRLKEAREARKKEKNELKANQKADEEVRKIVLKRIQKHEEQYNEWKINSIQTGFEIFSQYNDNEMSKLSMKYDKDRERIEATIQDEEEKNKALERLDAEYEKKSNAVKKRQAIANKAMSLFNIAIRTAESIAKVAWNPILVGITAALGAAQAAMVVAQPIPLQKGAYVPGSKGGTMAMVGEGNKSEIVLPLDIGVTKLAAALIDKLHTMTFPKASSPVAAMAGAGGAGRSLTLNIGTFIGDDRGIKDLTRRIIPIINQENTRKGLA